MALVYKAPVETTHRPSDLELQQNFETIANNIARAVVATQETVHQDLASAEEAKSWWRTDLAWARPCSPRP